MIDPQRKQELAKEGRLWLLALVCAVAGAITVSITDSLGPGVLVFLASVVVLGPVLWAYEKHRR